MARRSASLASNSRTGVITEPGGPWPEVGAYYQILWSAEDPPNWEALDATLTASGEVVLYENWTVKPYGYWDPTPLIVLGEAIPNIKQEGYLYARLFSDASPNPNHIDTLYSNSPGVPTSSLPVYDPMNPSTIALLTTPPVMLVPYIPEPSVGVLFALFGLILTLRRRIVS